MRKLRGRLVFWARACVLLLATRHGWAAPVEAEVRAQARALAYAGVEAYAVQNYRVASDKLEESFRLLRVPSLGLWSARALARLGKWVEAQARYRAVAELAISPTDPPVQQSAKDDAARELRELLLRMPHLTLQLRGASVGEVEVELDGVVLTNPEFGHAQPVNPGRHIVIGTRGAEKSQIVLSIDEAGDEEVWLRFTPIARAVAPAGVTENAEAADAGGAPGAWRTGGFIALTAGGAGLAAGSVAYFLARHEYASFERRNLCVEGACSPAELDAYDTWRSLSIAGLISGGILTATGIALVIFTEDPSGHGEPQQSVTLHLGPAAAVLRGSF
jgi:hypothetical protein